MKGYVLLAIASTNEGGMEIDAFFLCFFLSTTTSVPYLNARATLVGVPSSGEFGRAIAASGRRRSKCR